MPKKLTPHAHVTFEILKTRSTGRSERVELWLLENGELGEPSEKILDITAIHPDDRHKVLQAICAAYDRGALQATVDLFASQS